MQVLEKLAAAATRADSSAPVRISKRWLARVRRTSGNGSYRVVFNEEGEKDRARQEKSRGKESFVMVVEDGRIVSLLRRTGSKGSHCLLNGGSDSHDRGCAFIQALQANVNAFVAAKAVQNGRCKRSRSKAKRKGRAPLSQALALQADV